MMMIYVLFNIILGIREQQSSDETLPMRMMISICIFWASEGTFSLNPSPAEPGCALPLQRV